MIPWKEAERIEVEIETATREELGNAFNFHERRANLIMARLCKDTTMPTELADEVTNEGRKE